MTREIIHLQAKQPVVKAAKNPANNTIGESVVPLPAVEKSFIKSKMASPKTGIKTIKNENFAIFSLLFPNNIPVEIVAPERESPGKTATA